MQTKTYKRFKNTKAERAVLRFLANHTEYKNSYFWTPPTNASGRRNMEFSTMFSFVYQGKLYQIRQQLSCSCKNVYWTSIVMVDGEKKDIRALKKLVA